MYKKVNVVMLPINEKAKISDVIKLETGELILLDELAYQGLQIDLSNGLNIVTQHLYITSDEEIKGGDWIYRYEDKKVFQSKSYFSAGSPIKKGLITKIIATTDKSITINGYDSSDEDAVVNCYLPQIPQQFIELYCQKYNEGNVIKEVEVEHLLFLEPGNTLNDRKYDKTILKVNLNNTINIKSAKDSWTRDEVVEFTTKLRHFINLGNKSIYDVDKWIETNL